MDRRKLLFKRRYNTDNYVFKGRCTKPLVNMYWGAGVGPDTIHYADNSDGTYTFYCINTNGARQWWDRFVWYNSDNVVSLEVNPNVEVFDTNNNRFNSTVIESYNFNGVKVRSKSLSETFYKCHSIDIINISSWNMVNNTSFYATFAANVGTSEITNLRMVNLPDDCGSKVTRANKMFGWNRGLTSIYGMTTVDFSNCTDMSEMFCECFRLKNVSFKINGWVTSKCTDIHGMFTKCYDLDFSTIGDFITWDVSNVTNCDGMFGNCGFVNLDISGWDLSNCANISAMFQDELGKHTAINMSGLKLDLTKLTSHSKVFFKCNALNTVILTGCTDEVVNFIKTQLMTDIPVRVKSGSLTLVLDGGSYHYDDSSSSWILNS